MKLEESVAFVTGANRGLGKALVQELLARGAAKVYAGAREVAKVDGAVALDPKRVVAVRLDLTSGDLIAAAAKAAPDVTALFNNAGVLGAFDLLESSPAQIAADLETNFFGTLAMTRAFLPALERAASGGRGAALVNVLTVASLASMPALGGYAASKAAAFSMTQALRTQLAKRGIAVHAALPGPIDTDMIKGFDLPKTSAELVARAIVDGVEKGDEDIAPDPMARDVYAKWIASPKALEKQFGAM